MSGSNLEETRAARNVVESPEKGTRQEADENVDAMCRRVTGERAMQNPQGADRTHGHGARFSHDLRAIREVQCLAARRRGAAEGDSVAAKLSAAPQRFVTRA